MDINIPEGIVFEVSQIVEQKHTAKAYGSGLANVFATPAMVALMENAAYKSVEEFLPDGFSTVGMEINVKHLRATLPGKTVIAVSKIIAIDERKISFEIKVYENKDLAGIAEHKRFIIDNDRFMKKVNRDF